MASTLQPSSVAGGEGSEAFVVSRQGRIIPWLLAAHAAVLPAFSEARNRQASTRELSITLDGKADVGGREAGAQSRAVPVLGTPARGITLVAQAGAGRAQASGAQALPTVRLGVVQEEGTRIYRSARRGSRVLFRCQRGGALGLVAQTKTFYAVLMIDRSYGFVEKRYVQLHDYGVSVNSEYGRAADRIVQIAFEYMGVPYVWGGNTQRGIDCSGFVKSVFSRLGVSLPRVARDQFNVGQPVRWTELAPGDRLYFCSHGAQIDHTGIYIGNGRFIHASGSAGAVVVSSVTEPKFFRTLVGARRS